MKKIPLLESIKIRLDENRTDTTKGCVMLGVSPTNLDWSNIISQIDDEDLYTEGDNFGKEFEPHITILYGLHLDEGVRKQILDHYSKNFPNIAIIAKSVSLFENEKYDVLKYDIEVTPELAELNKFLTDNFAFTNSYPEYHPHCTLAYIKSGEGKKYCDKFSVPQEFKIKNLLDQRYKRNQDFQRWFNKYTLAALVDGIILGSLVGLFIADNPYKEETKEELETIIYGKPKSLPF